VYVLRLIWSLDDRAILVRLVLVDLVSHLGASLAPAILPAELETRIPVNSDLSPIDHLEIKTVECLLSLLPSSVLHETEPARSLLHLVESHDQAHYLPALAEKLYQLPLISIERQVSHVEGSRYLQSVLVLLR
jgi:hypothetical protein